MNVVKSSTTLFSRTVRSGSNGKLPIKKSLDAFFNKCMEIVDIRIDHYSNTYKEDNTKISLSRIKYKLKKLGTEFVFVPADKAANNVIVV